MQELFRNPPDRCPVHYTQYDSVTPCLPKPQSHCHANPSALSNASVADVLDQVQRQKQKWVPKPVVGTGLGDNDLLQVLGHVVIGKLALDNDVGQDRVSRRDARADGEGMQEGEVRDEAPDKERGREPHEGHDGAQENGEGLPLRLEVAARKLDTSEDQLYAEDEAGEIQDDRVEILLGATILSVSFPWVTMATEDAVDLRIIQGSDEIGRTRRKSYSSQERYHWELLKQCSVQGMSCLREYAGATHHGI